MSKYDFWRQIECKNRIINVKIRYSVHVSNVKIRYLAPLRISKWDIECQNTVFGPSMNVKIGF